MLEAFAMAAIVVVVAFCPAALAQGPLPDAPKPAVAEATPTPLIANLPSVETHRFWDHGNVALFAGVVATNAADFAVTYSNLQNGGRELNPVVRVFGRSAPGLALNFGGQTASIMGVSYFLHKTGHHKLERLVPMVNIGAGMTAVAYGFAHR